MHQHRFRDALQTSRGCWALREPTRKERAGELAGRGRVRALGCARLPARSRRRLPGPGRARDGGGHRGRTRSLSPSFFPPELLEVLCGRDAEASGFSSAGRGRPGQPLLLKGKLKVRLFAPLRHAAAPGRALDAQTATPFVAPQELAKAAGGRVARDGTEKRGRKCHDFFSCAPPAPHRPHPQFSGFCRCRWGKG